MLRPYQQRLVEGVHRAWAAGSRAVVMQLGTGGGKTHTAATVLAQEEGPVVFAAHLDSLVGDTAARLQAQGLACGIVAPWATPEPQHRIQVCSLGTLHARGTRPPARLVVLDECHRSEAPTVKAILGSYGDARLLGLTATPQRGDGAPLGDTFDAMVCGPTVRELTAMGALVPARLVVPADEGKRGDLLATMPPPGERRTILFAESKAEGAWQAELLRAAGYRTAEMYGETPRGEREALRAGLRGGLLDVLVNVGVAVEGFDEPTVDCIALDAPFGTLMRYLQAIGRGVRAAPGKTDCLVLDLRGAVYLHLPPDVPHEWFLTGEAVRSSSRGLQLSRCTACWAVFEGRGACPRCGELRVATFVPRRMADEARMVALSEMPEARRRELYRNKLIRVGMERRRMTRQRAERWADAELAKRLGGAV